MHVDLYRGLEVPFTADNDTNVSKNLVITLPLPAHLITDIAMEYARADKLYASDT